MSNVKMKGSLEERRENIEQAIREAFPRPKPDKDGLCADRWAYPEATYDDHVFVCEYVDNEAFYWRFPYTVLADGNVELGEKQRVELEVVVHDEDGEDTEPGPDDAVMATRINPAVARIAVATRLMSTVPEVKDAASLEEMNHAVLELMDTLSAKGMDFRDTLGLGDEDEDPTGDADYVPEDGIDVPADEDPLEGKGDMYSAMPTDDDEDDEGDPVEGYEVKNDGRVRLDPDIVKAQLAELGLDLG